MSPILKSFTRTEGVQVSSFSEEKSDNKKSFAYNNKDMDMSNSGFFSSEEKFGKQVWSSFLKLWKIKDEKDLIPPNPYDWLAGK